MSIKENKLIIVLIALGLTVSPSVSLSAGVGTSSSSSAPTKAESSRYGKSSKGRFDEAKSLIIQEKFYQAYVLLTNLPPKSKDEADRQNLLGFSARKYGEMGKAKDHYNQALKINQILNLRLIV